MSAGYAGHTVRINSRATSPADSLAGFTSLPVSASSTQAQPVVNTPRYQSPGNSFVGSISQPISRSAVSPTRIRMQAVRTQPQQVALGSAVTPREQAMMPTELLLEEQYSAVKKALALTNSLADRLKTLDAEGLQSLTTLALKLRPRDDTVHDLDELVEHVKSRPEGGARATSHGSTSEIVRPVKAMWPPRKPDHAINALTTPLITTEGHSMSSTPPRRRDCARKHHPPKARIARIAQAEDQVATMMKRSQRARQQSTSIHHSSSFTEQGFFATIAKSQVFDCITFIAIVSNAIWIAIETDFNKFDVLCEAPMIYQIVDNLFCSYFTFEIIVRVMAQKDKAALWTDSYFLFDFGCMLSMAWETWIQVLLYYLELGESKHVPRIMFLRLFRIVRGSRILRAGKVLMYLPELNILAKGIFAAMRSVFSTLLALGLLIYCFAIMFTQLLSDEAEAKDRFENVPMSLNFFLMQSICGIDSKVIIDMLRLGWLYYIFFLIFVFLGSLTIMNMLIGVVIDMVSSVGEAERARVRREKLDAHVQMMVEELDEDGNGMVEFAEFEAMFKDPEKLVILKDLGVDLVAFLDFTRFTFPEEGLTVSDVQRLVRMLMDSKPTTVPDMLEIQHAFSMELMYLEERILAHLPPLDWYK